MSDDRSQEAPNGVLGGNTSKDHRARYWIDKLGISEQRLRELAKTDLLEEAARRLRGVVSPIGDPLQLFTEVQVAGKFQISRITVRKLFKSVRLSERGTRYRATDIAAYIASMGNRTGFYWLRTEFTEEGRR